MCIGGKPSTPKAPPPAAPEATPTLKTPDQLDSPATSSNTTSGVRNPSQARRGLRIDMTGGSSSGGSGIKLPLD